MITIHHRVQRQDLCLGLVRVEGLQVNQASNSLAEELNTWIDQRRIRPLTEAEEACRKSSRDILRNGTYKPTGRGKPASEYLIRAANENAFPRINGPVDANNLISLKYCLPISLLDLERVETTELEIRLGGEGEQYIFNSADQLLTLKDLICGCAFVHGSSIPLITPIKDSMMAKIQPQSSRVLGCIYCSLQTMNPQELETIAEEFLRWLLDCGRSATGSVAILRHSDQVTL